MLALLEAKGRHALGYHGRVQVGGNSIDSYFERGPEGCRDLLRDLAASAFVCPGQPDRSRLLASADFRGPMFSVFSADELATIEEWIRGLDSEVRDEAPGAATPPLAGNYVPAQDLGDLSERSALRFGECDLAELAFHFLNIDLHPFARPYATKVAIAAAALFEKVGRMSLIGEACPAYAPRALEILSNCSGSASARPIWTMRGRS